MKIAPMVWTPTFDNLLGKIGGNPMEYSRQRYGTDEGEDILVSMPTVAAFEPKIPNLAS